MSYTVKISRPAEKFLRGLTDTKLYLRLRDALAELEENPRPAMVLNCKVMRSFIVCGWAIIESFIKFKIGIWFCFWSRSDIAAKFTDSPTPSFLGGTRERGLFLVSA